MSRKNRKENLFQLFVAFMALFIIIGVGYLIIKSIIDPPDNGSATPTHTATNPPNNKAEDDVNISAGEQKFFNDEPPEKLIYDNNKKTGSSHFYTIAVVAPGDSNSKGDALETLRGVAQAQSEFNQSRQNNQPRLRVLIVLDPTGINLDSQTKIIANKLLKDRSVLGVIGHSVTSTTKTALQVYNQAKVEDKLIAISPTSTGFNVAGDSKYFFRTVPSDTIAAKKLADYVDELVRIKKISTKRVAIFFDDSPYSKESLSFQFTQLISQRGGSIHNDNTNQLYNVSNNNFNARTAIEDALNSGTKVFMFAFTSSQREKALTILNVQEARTRYFLGGDGMYSLNFLANTGVGARNMVFAVPWHRSITNSLRSKAFVKASDQLWGNPSNSEEKVTWITATAYDATNALIQAIEESGDNPTRLRIQQILANNFSMDGVTGKIQFANNGDLKGETKLIIACQIRDSQPLEFRVEKCPS